MLAAHERLVAREVPNGEVAVDQPEHELPRRRPRGEGDVEVGVKIGMVEMVTKMFLYYLHERAWFRYGRLGREDSTEDALTKDN